MVSPFQFNCCCSVQLLNLFVIAVTIWKKRKIVSKKYISATIRSYGEGGEEGGMWRSVVITPLSALMLAALRSDQLIKKDVRSVIVRGPTVDWGGEGRGRGDEG